MVKIKTVFCQLKQLVMIVSKSLNLTPHLENRFCFGESWHWKHFISVTENSLGRSYKLECLSIIHKPIWRPHKSLVTLDKQSVLSTLESCSSCRCSVLLVTWHVGNLTFFLIWRIASSRKTKGISIKSLGSVFWN